MSSDVIVTEADVAAVRAALAKPPAPPPKKKLRPKGWNARRLQVLSEVRQHKAARRKAARGESAA